MAIAFDTSNGTLQSTGNPTSISWSHTCTGSNLILIVFVYNDDASDKVTSITYNSVAMTRANVVSITQETVYCYYLISPSTGTNTVVVTASASSNQLGGISQSYTGASQSGQPDSKNTNSSTSSGTTFSVSTTVVAANCWLVGAQRNDTGVPTAGSGTTLRQTENTMTGADSNGTVGTGSQSLNFSTSSGEHIAGTIISISPFLGSASHNLSLMGVGN